MKVIKRDGSIVDYSGDKIILAVMKALLEFEFTEEQAREIAEDVEDEILGLFDEESETVDIETIQDTIEEALANMGHFKVSKAYVIYRQKRTEIREKNKEVDVFEYRLLSPEFIEKYKHKPNPFPSALGESLFYRTYARWIPEKKRREYFWETVRRAVEYNCSLVDNVSSEEAETLFDNIYNLKQFLSGRTLYTGGTDVSKRFVMSNFNCSAIVVDYVGAFHETLYMLLLGSGVGFRALPEDVDKLPKFNSQLEVIDKNYIPVPKGSRKEHTELTFPSGNVAFIVIGDSKSGWTMAIKHLIELYTESFYREISTVVIDYDNIRPFGEQLKTFGGTASGHTAIQSMITKIAKVIENRGLKDGKQHIKLKPIDVLDMETSIAEGVVVGGIRRSSLIGFGDEYDTDFLYAKQNLYVKNDKDIWEINQDIINRQLSNNTVFYKEKPSREKLHNHIQTMKVSGEPAILWSQEAIRRNPNFKLTNPCGEILLDTQSCCNLTTVNVMGFVKEDGTLDIEGLMNAQRLSTRSGLRMACVEMEIHAWNEKLKRDRLIGCSLTGWQDMVNATNMDMAGQKALLRQLRDVVDKESESYAKELGVNKPLLATTIKPEGSLSQLPTVSSGCHFNHSEFIIRRMRVTNGHPIVKVFEDLGYPTEPDVGQTEENCTRKVVSFAIKSPRGRNKYDVTAIEQLEIYKMFMENYTQHNTSITVHCREHEWLEVEQWLWDNWDTIIGISFISLDDSFYQLLPYEAITEEKYNEMKSKEKPFSPELLFKYEAEEFKEEEVVDEGCASGACAVR